MAMNPPRSILGSAGQAAFRGVGRPITRPLKAGAALAAPGARAALTDPNNGVGSAGTAINPAALKLAAGVAPAGTHQVTTTVAPPLPNMTGDAWRAQLSPDQLGALGNAQATYTQNLGTENQDITDANTRYAAESANAQFAHDSAQDQANQEMAARGLFVSGIHDSDLTDIQRTLTLAQTTAKATLDTLVGEATRAITSLNSGWGATLGAYMGDAAQNAAAAQQAATTTQTTNVPNAPARPAPARSAPASAAYTPQRGIAQQAIAGHPNWAGPQHGGGGRARINPGAMRTYGRL